MIVYVNGEREQVADDATVAAVLERLDVQRPRRGLAATGSRC